MNPNTETIRQLVISIDMESANIRVLVQQILEKANRIDGVEEAGQAALEAINCFATCIEMMIDDVCSQSDRIISLFDGTSNRGISSARG